MFTSREHLVRRSGKKGVDRPQYLRELVEEYNSTSDLDRRQQVVANLANFSYDPLNFQWLKEAHVVPLFLEILSLPQQPQLLTRFAAAGVSNLTLAPTIVPELVHCGAPALLLPCLPSSDPHTVLSALTALIYFCQLGYCGAVSVAASLVSPLQNSEDPRICNLACLLLQELVSVPPSDTPSSTAHAL